MEKIEIKRSTQNNTVVYDHNETEIFMSMSQVLQKLSHVLSWTIELIKIHENSFKKRKKSSW